MTLGNLQRAKLTEWIKDESGKLGFFATGISQPGRLDDDARRVEDWLEGNNHGEMSWMERNREKRYDPTRLVEGVLSIITVLCNYTPKEKIFREDEFQVSNYAYGKDYHRVIKDKLYQLLGTIEEKTGKRKARVFVDSAPVLDRAWARKSGLGFIGKNTLLINRKGGSYFFIGHLMLDLALNYDENREEKNFCGSCTLCLKDCPTGALEPFRLDANKCISYLTIEHRSKIPERFKDKMHNWIFGCDICQEVCPWNREVVVHHEPDFDPPEKLKKMNKTQWRDLSEEDFTLLFRNSAIQRVGFEGLKRNIHYLPE
ncbi:MAG: tRNA epoxyqueuosine(34) reductase QueG [bacterium]